MAFRKGGEAAQEAAAKSGAQFARTHFLSIPEDDPQAVLRYLTDKDDWIYVDQHASIPTKNKPQGYEGNWPSSMPAVCRHDEAFKGTHSDCYICDHMQDVKNQWGRSVSRPTVRIWALACLREEVVGTPEMVADGSIGEDQVGKRIGFKDKTREVQEVDDQGKPIEGKTREERAIVVVNMSPSNYFNGLTAIGQVFGTVCDRDFVVKRSGSGKDTEYTHISLDPTPNLKPGTESWKRYEDAIKEQNLDLEAVVSERASDEYYARFFDPTKTAASTGGSGSTAASNANRPEVPDAPSADVDQDRLAAMRERVRGTAKPSMAEVD